MYACAPCPLASIAYFGVRKILRNRAAMEIVVGTYEELTLCYRIVPVDEEFQFELKFTDHSHTGCIRTVAVSKRGILATGSSDEIIKLFNLKKQFEIGTLMHHNGIVSSLTFHGKTHMFSTSHDGTIGVWQVGKWECLRTLRGHKGPVYSVSVHPSGKMALSVSQDKTLRIWNLMTGKCAYVTARKQVADFVVWSPSGTMYVVVTNTKAEIYDVETAEVMHTIQMAARIQDLKFLDNDTVILGGDDGKVEIHDISTNSRLHEISTDTNRVKSICWCRSPSDSNSFMVTTASSDGYIKLWALKLNTSGSSRWQHRLLGQIQTKFRITTAALYHQSGATQSQPVQKRPAVIDEATPPKKKKLKVEHEDEEHDTSSSEKQTDHSTAKTKNKKRKKPKKVVKASMDHNRETSGTDAPRIKHPQTGGKNSNGPKNKSSAISARAQKLKTVRSKKDKLKKFQQRKT